MTVYMFCTSLRSDIGLDSGLWGYEGCKVELKPKFWMKNLETSYQVMKRKWICKFACNIRFQFT